MVDRFLIILNIYNKTINDNTLNLIICRLPIILFQYEGQQFKLKALQLYIHSHKNNDYKSEINFSAWFESIFYIQNSFLCNDYIGSNTLIMKLVKQLKSGCSEYKRNMINKQIENRENELNFYQILMNLIVISVHHRILLKSKTTNTSSLLYDILRKPEYKLINKLIDDLFIYKNKNLNGDIYKVFHTKLIAIEKTYKKISELYRADFFEKISK